MYTLTENSIIELSKMNYKSWSQAMKEAYGVKPKEVNSVSWRADFYAGILTRDFFGSVEIVCPDHWSKDYIRNALLLGGQIAVVKRNGIVVPAEYTVKDRTLWKYPKIIMGSSEVNFADSKVGSDCEIMYLNTASDVSFQNPLPQQIIDIFATKMADCDASIDINLFNTKAGYIAEAESKQEADDMRAAFTKIYSGSPMVFWRRKRRQSMSDRPLGITTLPIKNNFVADLVQKEKDAIRAEFLTMIGINNSNTEKKERLIVDEVNANNELIDVSVDLWQSNCDDATKRIKDLFGIDFEIKFYPKRRKEREDKQREYSRSDSSVEDQKQQ